MEMGIGFVVGILAGSVVALISAVLVAISRRAMAGKTNLSIPDAPTSVTKKVNAGDPAMKRRHTAGQPGADASNRTANTQTMVVGEVDSYEAQLSKNITEVRELLLHLADVVSAVEDASGEASVAFTSARQTIGQVDSNASPALAEAQRILIGEIDRVIKSNAKLQFELDNANKAVDEQRQQIEELRVQARIDALTKIPNRAAFDERLAEYMGLLDRGKISFCLLLLDIDFFKEVNDKYGHLNGDRILRGIARRIGASIRTNDFAARYGGEEFAVILPATDVNEAAIVADRVRADISKTNFRMDDVNVKVTISGGLIQSRHDMSAEDIIAEADHALYQAKNTGRNRIVMGKK